MQFISQPRTVIVDTKGDDRSGSGLLTLPYKTIYRALEMTLPGDIIQLRSGTYSGGFTISRPSITLRSYPGEWAVIASPIIEPSTSVVVWIDTFADNTRIQQLEIVGGYYYGIMLKTTWEW